MIRLAVRVRRAEAELALAELLELAPGGVEEVQIDADVIEYGVYGAAGELPRLPELTAAAGPALVEVSSEDVRADWHERWRDFHRPVMIDAPASAAKEGHAVPALRVRPAWASPLRRPPGQLQEIVIDPGQAFGTGAHASTRTCLELLLALAREQRSGPLIDIGTGSGVLAIAAALLGFGPVLALDNEHESVTAARENARANGANIAVRRFDLRTQELPWSEIAPRPADAPVLVANLLRPLLLELAHRLPAVPAGLVAGGLLRAEADEVAAAFGGHCGLRERERRASGDWAALWLTPA